MTLQLAVMRAKDVAKQHDWGNRLEVRDCPADLAADTDIPVVLTMLSNATGAHFQTAVSWCWLWHDTLLPCCWMRTAQNPAPLLTRQQ
jgi:hypothetical protein